MSGDPLSALVSPTTKWDAAIFLKQNYVNYDVEKKNVMYTKIKKTSPGGRGGEINVFWNHEFKLQNHKVA